VYFLNAKPGSAYTKPGFIKNGIKPAAFLFDSINLLNQPWNVLFSAAGFRAYLT
jgi:hypothetical protein